ncbi:hypothetical protein HYU50_00415 [Candidatus Woesearchaeota archaeon]|nr:hypothetical protein [Candidatus Woesearchaeota archaeon]
MGNAEKILTGFVAFTIIIAVFALFYVSKSLFFPLNSHNIDANAAADTMGKKMGRMSLTPFDVKLAKEFMDKNNDGKCDSCGMPVDLCISSGQLQCNMDSKSTIGILESQHIHADWKIYINGEPLDLSDKSHMERMRNNQPVSSFIHVDSDAPPPEKTGDILHMHATGVPLWIFFESVEMDFNKDCITLENKEKFCNDGNKKLKFFVNGKENNEFENYVFKDLDRILISYGNESQQELQKQLNSITDFAKTH